MRVIVCGGREYDNGPMVLRTLADMHITALAHGGATGADELANIVAMTAGIPVTVYPAQWGEFRQAAGPIRNQRMLDEFKPDAVIAFPGGKGTADMVRRAKAAGVRVIEVEEARDDG